MTTFILILIAIIYGILTLWLVVIPAGVLVGFFAALRRGGLHWKGWERHSSSS
jgi:hypothetical protein